MNGGERWVALVRGTDRPGTLTALTSVFSTRGVSFESLATGAVHAAALCRSDGAIAMAREDVGRHSAFDKLIGAMLRAGIEWDGGFALLSSRCSYELVEKAVLAGCPMLVTISAPTSLAVERARASGLALRVLARPDALLAPA